MILRLNRDVARPDFTLGKLYVGSRFECYTVEDQVRIPGQKVPGETAIPAGRYQVLITRSRRFGRDLPEILNVPGFTGIRIHPGNTKRDTDGCILPGAVRTATGVGQSRAAFAQLFEKIEAALDAGGEVWIEISDG